MKISLKELRETMIWLRIIDRKRLGKMAMETEFFRSEIKNQQSSLINPVTDRTLVMLVARLQRCRVIHEKDREEGLDIRSGQELLGHTDIRTTMIYQQLAGALRGEIGSPLDDL